MKHFIKISKAAFILFLAACSSDTPVTPTGDVTYKEFMHELYTESNTTFPYDYVKLELNNQVVEIDYTQDHGKKLCYFPESNVSGMMCQGCEGHAAQMTFFNGAKPEFPDLPVKPGMAWPSEQGISVTKVNFKGLLINIKAPKRLINTLRTGTYKIQKDIMHPGAWLAFHWEVIHENGDINARRETGYILEINTDKYHKVALVRIDKSEKDKVRLTWEFEATFAGKAFGGHSDDIVYEMPVKGVVSYNILLNK